MNENTAKNTETKNAKPEAQKIHPVDEQNFNNQCSEWGDKCRPAFDKNVWTLYCNVLADANDNRTVLQHVYSDGEKLVATNSRILVFSNTDLPKGFYDPAIVGKGKDKIHTFIPVKQPGVFPNWKQIVPECEDSATHKLNVNFSEQNMLYPELFALNFTLATVGNGILLQDEFIDCVIDTYMTFECYFKNSTTPVVFRNGDLNVIIMPVRDGVKNSKIGKAIASYRSQIKAEIEEKQKTFELESEIKPNTEQPATESVISKTPAKSAGEHETAKTVASLNTAVSKCRTESVPCPSAKPDKSRKSPKKKAA